MNKRFSCLMTIGFLLFCSPTWAELVVEITKGQSDAIPIAIVPFSSAEAAAASFDVAQLVSDDLDGLLREVVLDKATGICGKTVIHPTHVRPVHAMFVVTAEEYCDALSTLCLTDGGVCSSEYANKMIESKPHARWAAGILRRAAVFGVLRADRTFVDLLDIEDVSA